MSSHALSIVSIITIWGGQQLAVSQQRWHSRLLQWLLQSAMFHFSVFFFLIMFLTQCHLRYTNILTAQQFTASNCRVHWHCPYWHLLPRPSPSVWLPRLSCKCRLVNQPTHSGIHPSSLGVSGIWFSSPPLNARLRKSVMAVQNTQCSNCITFNRFHFGSNLNVFLCKITPPPQLSISSSISLKRTGKWCCIQTNIAVSKCFKSYLHIDRFTPSVFNNFSRLTIAAANVFLTGIEWLQDFRFKPPYISIQ
jgi:hypothetical protein